MGKSRFKKSFVLVILVFFIGASIVPNISGNVGKMTVKSTNEDITNFLLSNDYVNVYWKFDDCSGDTLTDTAHNYDGTISGATWTTDGESGCALIFDGIDDYVLLNPYSEQLGFNKTDDMIYSFWFKSNSGGLIYSSTASWGSNPAFRIELLSNGTLFFNPWTQNCGIKHYSSGTYNDGDWHHAVYYYNGITTNPTVTLYIDDDFDSSMTHWLCEIEHDEFAKTRIGMHAYYSTDAFNGYIDDFKMIKYEEGNKQNPPIIDGPTEGQPNVEYEYTFVTEDPEEDEVYIQIDWDDGTDIDWIGPFDSGQEVTIDHEFTEEGFYEVKAQSKDRWYHSSWSEPYEVRIGNQPPDIPDISGPILGDVEVEYTFSFISQDSEGNDIYYYIDWGDETYDDWFGPFESGIEVTASHTWTTEDIYSIKAKAKDEFGSESDYSQPYLINIGDNAPDDPVINGKIKGEPGTEYSYTFVSTDPDGDDISRYVVDWGDDSGEVVITGPFASGEEVTESHSWNSEGTFTITAKSEDIWGAESGLGELKVTMPRDKEVANYLYRNLLKFLFERFPDLLPILSNIINN
jgi:hypothetical protein